MAKTILNSRKTKKRHLQYLNFKVGGTAILYMCIVYAAFLGVGGFINSTQPNEEHHDDHDDHHEHHGSFSPIIFALGVMLFLMGFPEFVDTVTPLINGEGGGASGHSEHNWTCGYCCCCRQLVEEDPIQRRGRANRYFLGVKDKMSEK